MISQSQIQPSSKLARCWRGSWYGLGFAVSAVFLFVMIWILWCYLGFSGLPNVVPQRRAIVDYGTTKLKSSEITPSTPLAIFLAHNSTSNSNSRGETQLGLDKRRDYATAISEDGLAKGDFHARPSSTSNSNSTQSRTESRDSSSKSPILHSGNDRPKARELSDDDRRIPLAKSDDDADSVAERIISPSATEKSRSPVGDRRSSDEKSTENSRRIDDDDDGRSRRPLDERRPSRDDRYDDRDRPLPRSYPDRDSLDRRPIDDSSRRRVDDHLDDREYSRDRRDRDDYPRRRYEDDIEYDRKNSRRDYDRKEDGRDIRLRDRDSSREGSRDVLERDSSREGSRDVSERDSSREGSRDVSERDRDDRYRSRSSDDRYRDSDDKYRSRYDDDRYESRKGDDGVDDRYRSSSDGYRRDDRSRDRPTDDKYKDDDRSRDHDRRRDRLPEDADDDRRKDDRYRSREASDLPPRSEDSYPRKDDRRYRDDVDDRRDRPPYRDEIRPESSRSRTDPSDYRSTDRVRNRDEISRTRDIALPSRRDEDFREESSRTRIRDDDRYDDSDRRRTRVRDERYDDSDRYGRDPLPPRRDDRDDYGGSRSTLSKSDDRVIDRDRSVPLVEDKALPKNPGSRSDDAKIDRRSYLTSDDDYGRNRPRTDVKPADDEYRPPRRRSDDTERGSRDDRYDDRRRSDYDDDSRDRSKGEYVRNRDRGYSRSDDDDRDYPRRDTRYDDRYPTDREVRLRDNRTDDRVRDRRIDPSRTVPVDPPLRSSTGRTSGEYQTEPGYYDDEYRRPPRRVSGEDDYPRRDSYRRDEPRVYSSRGEDRPNIRERRYESSRTPCTKRRNSFSEEPGLSFRRIDDDDCDDRDTSDRYLPGTSSSTRMYDDRRSPSARPLTPKEIIDEAYRHEEGENRPRDAIYPVYDPRVSNMTSPEIIRPNERRGTTITARRRKRALSRIKK